MLKKFLSEKVSGTKNALLFLSRASTHHRFTFSLWFLYELKHKVCFSKTVCGIFHFRSHLVFIKVYIFGSRKSMDSLTLRCHNSFQNKNNRKVTYRFTPIGLWFLSCKKKF